MASSCFNLGPRFASQDDPTVHSYDICNEPRCDDTTGKLARWIDETARCVKSLDPYTPVTCGLEGWFGQTNSKFKQCNVGGC